MYICVCYIYIYIFVHLFPSYLVSLLLLYLPPSGIWFASGLHPLKPYIFQSAVERSHFLRSLPRSSKSISRGFPPLQIYLLPGYVDSAYEQSQDNRNPHLFSSPAPPATVGTSPCSSFCSTTSCLKKAFFNTPQTTLPLTSSCFPILYLTFITLTQ